MIIPMPSLSDNSFVIYDIPINEKAYSFTFRWNLYNDCCFATIKDNDKVLFDGYALVNNSVIITKELPNLKFTHKDGLSFRPTRETFNQYVIKYD